MQLKPGRFRFRSLTEARFCFSNAKSAPRILIICQIFAVINLPFLKGLFSMRGTFLGVTYLSGRACNLNLNFPFLFILFL